MKSLFQWVMAATLICGTGVFTSCSVKDDLPVSPDQPEKGMPRVSKVYHGGSLVWKKNVMGSWITVIDRVDERALVDEYFWTGNRLDSIIEVTNNVIWDLEYDEQGRLVHQVSRFGNDDYTYEYDSKGRLSKSFRSILYDEDGRFNRVVTEYIYNGDKLSKAVKHDTLDGEEGVSTEEDTYTWEGDNVVSLSIVRTDADGYVTEETITAEYSTYLNPFKNFIPFLQKNFALSLKDEMWIWSKNVPKAMSASEKDHNEYDCKTTGDRITTFHSHLLAESETIFTEITSDYDIEYLD